MERVRSGRAEAFAVADDGWASVASGRCRRGAVRLLRLGVPPCADGSFPGKMRKGGSIATCTPASPITGHDFATAAL